MNQNVVYGKDREAIVPYDVAIWWHLAFDVDKSIFNYLYSIGVIGGHTAAATKEHY
jgi:hypothetical protein